MIKNLFLRYFSGFYNKAFSYCLPIYRISHAVNIRYSNALPRRARLLSTDFGYRFSSYSIRFYSTPFKFNSLPSTYLKDQSRGIANKTKDNKGKTFVIQGCYNLVSTILSKGLNYGSTQLEIENATFNNIKTWTQESKNSFIAEYGLGNPKVSKLIIDKRKIIIKILENWKRNADKDVLKIKDKLNEVYISYNKPNLKHSKKLKDLRHMYIISILDVDTLASIILSTFLTIVSNRNNLKANSQVDLQFDLGKIIFNRVLKNVYKKECEAKLNINNLNFHEWVSVNNKDNPIVNMFNVDNINISTYLVSCATPFINILDDINLTQSNLFNLDENSKRSYYIDLTDEISDMLNNCLSDVRVLPFHLPMVEEPKKYSHNTLGGYLLNNVEYRNTAIINNPHLKDQSKIESDNIYNMVNSISSTAFTVNEAFLNYLEVNSFKMNLLLDNPVDRYNHTKTDLKTWRRKNKTKYRAYLSEISEYEHQQNILSIANVYRKVPRIYFPVRLDQRGRIYCTPVYFNYQGNDLAKALILFADKSILNIYDNNSIDYFYSYGANCYGNGIDKQSRVKKVAWIKDNHNDIMNLNNGLLLSKAKNKYLFISFALEYIKLQNAILESKVDFIYTQLPIQLDATCNGYQHLSMLSRDNDLGKDLNLMSSKKDDVPQDFYGLLISKITTELKNAVDLTNSWDLQPEIEAYKRIIKFNPDRSLIKKPVMIESYNAHWTTSANALRSSCYCINEPDFSEEEVYDGKSRAEQYSARKYIINENSDHNTYLLENDFTLLVRTMQDVLRNDYPKLTKLRLYLTEVGKICNKLNLTIPWKLPSGLRVNQGYLKGTTFQIKPFEFSSKSFTVNHIHSDKLDKSKQIRALMPNLIHSLDATSLMSLYGLYSTINTSIFTVHDCFAVPIPYVERLIEFIQSVYFNLYSENNYLIEFDNCIIETIKTTYGEKCFIEDSNKSKYIIYEDEKIEYPNVKQIFYKGSDFELIFDALKNKRAIYAIN